MSYKDGGLDFNRYVVFERVERFGEGAIKPAKGVYFCLNCNGSDPHALNALRLYSDSVKDENPQLSKDIKDFLRD